MLKPQTTTFKTSTCVEVFFIDYFMYFCKKNNMVIKLRLSIFENKKSKWETLIINHYKSASKRNKEYSKVHSLDEMRAWWFNILEKNDENEIEEFILAVTEANEKNIIYHPI